MASDTAAAGGSQLTFTQGLLVGQLSIVILAALFVRYFIFEDVTTALEKERQSVCFFFFSLLFSLCISF